MSEVELWEVNRSVLRRCKQLASQDSPDKIPSMGALYRIWMEHPLRKYILAEESRRFNERAELRPILFRTLFDDLSNVELDSYVRWFREKPPDQVDKLSMNERVAMWRRETRIVLPVVALPPLRGGPPPLPRQANARRPDNQERERPSREVPEKAGSKAEPSPLGGTEDGVSFSIEDLEVH